VVALILGLILLAILFGALGIVWIGIPLAILAVVLLVMRTTGFGRRRGGHTPEPPPKRS